jgi:DNA-binding transcriptional MerR regulator/predicted transcriptional regulator YdeE
MLRIGDFSTLTQITIKTLRYYDEQGLLPPAYIDAATGYRYYAVSQLPRLHRILALRDLGFSLDQIGTILNDGISVEQLKGMLLLRQAEQQQRVDEEQARLARLKARLGLMEKENRMTNEVVIKQAPAQWIASVRETIANYPSIGKLYPEVVAALPPGSFTISIAIWHDKEHRERDVDAEAGFCLKAPVEASGRVQVYELPAATVATTIHHGAYNRLSEAYDMLLRWVGSNDYQIVGPVRELYLQISMPVRQDDESYITEIQVPVAKAE